MERYIIYCTAEQTKKALELGAPLRIIEATDESQVRAINTIANGKHKEQYTLVDNLLISNPTAEQMIGWLEEQPLIHEIDVNRGIKCWYFDIGYTMRSDDSSDEDFNTRKEATLAAIDAALEYLSKNKK